MLGTKTIRNTVYRTQKKREKEIVEPEEEGGGGHRGSVGEILYERFIPVIIRIMPVHESRSPRLR